MNGTEKVKSNSVLIDLQSARSLQSGLSCLHIAAAMGHVDTVSVLCERGANVDQQFRFEEQDVTAYDLAESQLHEYVCQVLKSFGARQPLHNTLPSQVEANQ